jgi:hypothetical protein
MLPAVPLWLKAHSQQNGIEGDFQLETAVAAYSPVWQVVQLAQRNREMPPLDGWDEGKNPAGEKPAVAGDS